MSKQNSDKLDTEPNTAETTQQQTTEPLDSVLTADDIQIPDELTAKEQTKEETPSLEEQIVTLNDKLLRMAAELDNSRKRAERERSETLKYAVTSFARDMVAVGDNLYRALSSISEEEKSTLPETIKNVLEGVSATQRDLMSALSRNNVKALEPMGEKFDANFHEAMFEAPGTGKETGTIIEVIETGYVIGDRLLRAAKVGIAKAEK